MFISIFLVFALCAATDDMFDIIEDLFVLRAPAKLDLRYTFFSALESYHEKATAATEKTYPWIAQVVHSKTENFPYMCTASCVHEGIFITASRCIFSLKVKHTSVLYHSKRLAVRAFVVPSNQTVQKFDDIAFIVLEKKAGDKFNVVQLYPPNEVKRTDERFKWFTKINFTGFKAVGYVMEKKDQSLKLPGTPHKLKELPISIHMDICFKILTNSQQNGFHVPCYHSCDFNKFKKLSGRCQGYLGVEGAAIINDKTKKLLGVATWGPKFREFDLPVGFSVVNSKTFVEDFECAKKVRNAKPKSEGSYQELCKL